MLTKRQLFIKRIFDVFSSILLLPFVIIPILVLFVLAVLSTSKSGLFVQERVGYKGKLFKLYKIRSLKGSDHIDVVDIKKNETVFGRWLRRTKLDELPQIFNILIGNMSWVGPRPDVPGYADRLQGEDRVILEVKPGLTGPATLKYKNEDNLLLQQDNPLKYNDEVIWPDKVNINKEYITNWSLSKDIYYLWISIF